MGGLDPRRASDNSVYLPPARRCSDNTYVSVPRRKSGKLRVLVTCSLLHGVVVRLALPSPLPKHTPMLLSSSCASCVCVVAENSFVTDARRALRAGPPKPERWRRGEPTNFERRKSGVLTARVSACGKLCASMCVV